MKLERGCVPPAGAKIHDSAVSRSATLRAMTSDNQRGSGRLVGLIGWWKSRADAFWSPPEWMDQPRGRDVSPAAGWFPVVSGVTALADLAFQLSPPPGHGHDYATSYVDAWSRVVPPPGWTDADTDRLEMYLHP